MSNNTNYLEVENGNWLPNVFKFLEIIHKLSKMLSQINSENKPVTVIHILHLKQKSSVLPLLIFYLLFYSICSLTHIFTLLLWNVKHF